MYLSCLPLLIIAASLLLRPSTQLFVPNARLPIECSPPSSLIPLSYSSCRLAADDFRLRFNTHGYGWTLTHNRNPTAVQIKCPYTIEFEDCAFTIDFSPRNFNPPVLPAQISDYGLQIARTCVRPPGPDGGSLTLERFAAATGFRYSITLTLAHSGQQALGGNGTLEAIISNSSTSF